MSTISVEEVKRLADLAEIGITDEEAERLTEDLVVIAEYAGQVSEIADVDVALSAQSIQLVNVLREDVAGTPIDPEELLAAAPEQEDSMFKVPQILEEEQ
ncbi:MAG: Asp-tRNA(Asn)/Glu-tRNA(Gln) amidotransferase subunit GatC [Scrofimicrobium sp.]